MDDVNRRVANIVDAIAAGRSGTALLDKLEILESEKAELEATQSQPAPEPVRLHPNIAEHYVAKVNDLRNYLNKEDSRVEAAQILRSLVDEIRLHPIDGNLQIELIGDLAALLGFAQEKVQAIKSPDPQGIRTVRNGWLRGHATGVTCSLITPICNWAHWFVISRSGVRISHPAPYFSMGYDAAHKNQIARGREWGRVLLHLCRFARQ